MPSFQITFARPVVAEMARKLPPYVAPYNAPYPVMSPQTLLKPVFPTIFAEPVRRLTVARNDSDEPDSVTVA